MRGDVSLLNKRPPHSFTARDINEVNARSTLGAPGVPFNPNIKPRLISQLEYNGLPILYHGSNSLKSFPSDKLTEDRGLSRVAHTTNQNNCTI